MSDYVVAVGFQTDAGTVKRSTDQLADSVGKVGKAQDTAAGKARDLTSASAQLERVQTKIEVQQRRLADATNAVQRMQARGATTSKAYTDALDKQVRAQDALAGSMVKAQRLQSGRGAAKAGPDLLTKAAALGAGYVTGAAVGRLVTDSVSEYGRLNQAVGQSRQIFGEYAKDVDRFGQSSAHSIGLSRQAAIEASDGLGTLFQSLQIGQGDAAKMSTRLVGLSADVAAFNHAQQPEVLDAFRGGLTGQYDALQKYNVILSTASVRQEAVRLGLVQGKDALSQTAQAQAAYSLILQQTNGQQGAFLTSSDAVTRQQQQLRASMENAKVELGRGLTPALIGLEHIASGTLLPALSGLGKAIGFIGSHESTRHIAELALVLYGATKAVDLLAAAWGRVAVAAGSAATAEVAADAAGTGAGGAAGKVGAGGSALARGGKFLATNPEVALPLAALLYGVEQLIADRNKQKDVRSEVSAAQAAGPAAEIALASKYGVGRGSNPGQFIVDPKVDADRRKAGIELLEAADRQLQTAREIRADIVEAGAYTVRQQTALNRSARATTAAENARENVANAYAELHDPTKMQASAAQQPLSSLFAVPASTTKRIDLSSDNSSVRSAQRAVKLAEDRLKSLQSGAPAELAAASRAVSLAEARLNALEQSGKASALQIQAARNSLINAEDRLTRLKNTGKGSTLQLEAAENRLADARDRLNRATGKRSKDQEKNNQDTSISAKDVLKRADATAAAATNEAKNVRKLVAAGVSAPVIEELKTLEQSAPGTIANVAKALTPAFVRQLNADAAARARAATALAMLGGQAKYNDSVRQAKILGAQAGKAYHDGWLAGLNGTGDRQGLPLDDTRPYTGPAPKPAPKANTPTARQGLPRDDLRVTTAAPKTTLTAPRATAPAPTVTRQAIPIDERSTLSLPTTSTNASPVVHLSTASVTQVATALATMSPRVTTHQNTFQRVDSYEDVMRRAQNAERLAALTGLS